MDGHVRVPKAAENHSLPCDVRGSPGLESVTTHRLTHTHTHAHACRHTWTSAFSRCKTKKQCSVMLCLK